jgi:hypothetical protein
MSEADFRIDAVVCAETISRSCTMELVSSEHQALTTSGGDASAPKETSSFTATMRTSACMVTSAYVQ